jgi:AcrR family transcriptional regulator
MPPRQGSVRKLESSRPSRALVPAGREGAHVTEMQQRRLLLAFTEVLAEMGLMDTGVGRVCKRAGVSRRTFYDLFDDRETCFLAAFDTAVRRISQSVIPAYRQEGRWYERVRSALSALLEYFEEDPALARVCVVETLKAGPAVMERRRRVLEVLTAAVDEGRIEAKTGAGPPPLTGQSTIGGVLAVIHARVLEDSPRPNSSRADCSLSLIDLLNPLMSMIVHPYLGPAAARRELDRHVPSSRQVRNGHDPERLRDPFKDLPIRITFRTARVLATIAAQPHASNRQIADTAGVADQGQISKLLSRLESFELIENQGQGQTRGEPNAWRLTQRGHALQHALGTPTS